MDGAAEIERRLDVLALNMTAAGAHGAIPAVRAALGYPLSRAQRASVFGSARQHIQHGLRRLLRDTAAH